MVPAIVTIGIAKLCGFIEDHGSKYKLILSVDLDIYIWIHKPCIADIKELT